MTPAEMQLSILTVEEFVETLKHILMLLEKIDKKLEGQ